jgi:hypothetical protein
LTQYQCPRAYLDQNTVIKTDIAGHMMVNIDLALFTQPPGSTDPVQGMAYQKTISGEMLAIGFLTGPFHYLPKKNENQSTTSYSN